MRRRSGFAAACIVGGALGTLFLACSDDDESAPAKPDAAADASDAARDTATAEAAADGALREPFCENVDKTSLVFCADFEGKGGAMNGFDDTSITADPDVDASAAIAVSAEGGVTHPSVVLDVRLTQAGDAGVEAGASAFVSKSLEGNAPNSYLHYEVEMDFRVVGTASLAYVALSVLRFPTGLIKQHGFAVYDGNVFGKVVPKDFAVKDDKSLWHHAKVVLTRPSGSTTASFAVTIAIDGTLVDNIGGADPGATGTPTLRLGAFDLAPNAGGSVRAQFDNVVVRRR